MKLCLQNCGYKMNIIIKFHLRMSSPNFEVVFQLIKDYVTKETLK